MEADVGSTGSFAHSFACAVPPLGRDDVRRRYPFAPGQNGRELSKKPRGDDRGPRRNSTQEDYSPLPPRGLHEDDALPLRPNNERPPPRHGPGRRRWPCWPHGRQYPSHDRRAELAIASLPPLGRRRRRRHQPQELDGAQGGRPPDAPPGAGTPSIGFPPSWGFSGRRNPPHDRRAGPAIAGLPPLGRHQLPAIGPTQDCRRTAFPGAGSPSIGFPPSWGFSRRRRSPYGRRIGPIAPAAATAVSTINERRRRRRRSQHGHCFGPPDAVPRTASASLREALAGNCRR